MDVSKLNADYEDVARHMLVFVCPKFDRKDSRLSNFFKVAENCFNTRFTHAIAAKVGMLLRGTPEDKIFQKIDSNPRGRVQPICNGETGSAKIVVQFEGFTGFDNEVLSHVLTVSLYDPKSDEQLLLSLERLIACSNAYCATQSSPRVNVEKIVRPAFAINAYDAGEYIYGGIFTDLIYIGKSTSEIYDVDEHFLKNHSGFVSKFLDGYFIDNYQQSKRTDSDSIDGFESWFKRNFAFSQLSVALQKARAKHKSTQSR